MLICRGLTVAVEVDHGEDHEGGVPAELEVGVALPRVAAHLNPVGVGVAPVGHEPRHRADDRRDARQLGQAVHRPHHLGVAALLLRHADFSLSLTD